MRTFAIGDIHGCLKELEILIGKLETDEGLSRSDKLVFLGDYVDRGPDSKGVIDFLLDLSKRQDCVFLMGNHEDMMMYYSGIDHGEPATELHVQQMAGAWLYNGGQNTLDSYDIDIASLVNSIPPGSPERIDLTHYLPESHVEFLSSLNYYYIEGKNLLVHAGISRDGLDAGTPGGAAMLSTSAHFLWDRETFERHNSFGTMIYGHTPNRQGVRWLPRENDDGYHTIGLDVGCVFGDNPLTALRLDNLKLTS